MPYKDYQRQLENSRYNYHRRRALGLEKWKPRILNRTQFAKRMWYTSRMRAKLLGLEFTITPEDIIIPDRCPILGMPLTYLQGHGNIVKSNASMDRIDSTKGYTKENIWVISNLANKMKQNATAEELYTFAAGIILLHQEGKL